MWLYKTFTGTFYIRKQPDKRWGLWVDDELLGSYHSPGAAADDVYTQRTGYHAWDSLSPVSKPCDLSEWEQSS